MACIACFLEDEYQERLRGEAALRSARFELQLSVFADLFNQELRSLQPSTNCPLHKSLEARVHTFLDELNGELLRLSPKDIILEVKACYDFWIENKQMEAIDAMQQVVGKYNFRQLDKITDKFTMFRGRISKGLSLTKEDILHVPFTKRQLVKNYRYSISGQPLLYLSLTPLTVIAELREGLSLDRSDLYLSYFALKIGKTLKLFNFTNDFPYEISIYNSVALRTGVEFHIDKTTTINLSKFVLISCCSFRRRDNSVFVEPYVLPQLLTQVIAKTADGILFSSTRLDHILARLDAGPKLNLYRENAVLFTKYGTDEYDMELLNKFDISEPFLASRSIPSISKDEFDQARANILVGLSTSKVNPDNMAPDLISIDSQLALENVLVSESGKEVSYFESTLGKIHWYLLYLLMRERENTL